MDYDSSWYQLGAKQMTNHTLNHKHLEIPKGIIRLLVCIVAAIALMIKLYHPFQLFTFFINHMVNINSKMTNFSVASFTKMI